MNIIISNIKINEVSKTEKGLVGFATALINNSFCISSIGIYIALSGGYKGFRLTYPTKKRGADNYGIFFPINGLASKFMNEAVINEYLRSRKIND